MKGYYCPSGSTHNDTMECIVGHRCESGRARPDPCSAREYQDERGQYKCKECPEGFYWCVCGVIVPSNCTAGKEMMSNLLYLKI